MQIGDCPCTDLRRQVDENVRSGSQPSCKLVGTAHEHGESTAVLAAGHSLPVVRFSQRTKEVFHR